MPTKRASTRCNAGMAVITRMGAPSRRGETPAVAAALAPHRPLIRLPEPARIDGGVIHAAQLLTLAPDGVKVNQA